MRSEAHELQVGGVGFPINENEIGTDVAIAEIFPIPGERMIDITTVQRGIGGEWCRGR